MKYDIWLNLEYLSTIVNQKNIVDQILLSLSNSTQELHGYIKESH